MTGRDNNKYILQDMLDICYKYFESFTIVDTGSSDNTSSLASIYKNVFLKNLPEWNGDWPQAYAAAIEDLPIDSWFLFMDADEIPNQELLKNINILIKNAENIGANNIGLRSNLHIYNWDNICEYTELPNIKANPNEKNCFRKHVLVKKFGSMKIPATGGHCSFQPQPNIQYNAMGHMFYNHYKSKYTIGRSLLTHGFQFPFSFSGLQDKNTKPCENECCSYPELKIKKSAIDELKEYNNKLTKYDNSFIHIEINNNVVKLIDDCDNNFLDRKKIVLKFIQDVCNKYNKNINGQYMIGLHDKYDENYYENILVFSKNKNNTKQILIPDIYAMLHYYNKLNIVDNIPLKDKVNKAFFSGSTTGSLNPIDNERIKICLWNDINYCESHISNVCQMNIEDISKAHPDSLDIISLFGKKTFTLEEHHKYKYLLNIDGNTCCWDRFPWILNSNCICIKQKTDNICWYYSLLDNNNYYEYTNIDEIKKIIDCNDTVTHLEMIKRNKLFVNNYLSYENHLQYMGDILYHSNNIKI